MTTHATGAFEVKTIPQALDEQPGQATLGRFSLDKQFHGDLEATSQGEMLTAGRVEGHAGYVAVERVSGTLHGRRGTFALQHTGSMTPAALRLSITVVPNTATGELEGLAGTMAIDITGGEHVYDFEYTFAAQP